MNNLIHSIKYAVPAFIVGSVVCVLAYRPLNNQGKFAYEPNPGALAGSPFGRTIGMALQGPVTKFWDRGIGSIEQEAEMTVGSRPDEKLFNWIVEMNSAKAYAAAPEALDEAYTTHVMARIEKKLALAWEMDPRNFANYAIYQMFLWEGFTEGLIETNLDSRSLSLQTLETSLSDQGSPVSLLTAGQAAYDLVFAARTSQLEKTEESKYDISTYGNLLAEIIADYEELVAGMQRDGRWDEISEAKKLEFAERKSYLEYLQRETRQVIEQYSNSDSKGNGGHQS